MALLSASCWPLATVWYLVAGACRPPLLAAVRGLLATGSRPLLGGRRLVASTWWLSLGCCCQLAAIWRLLPTGCWLKERIGQSMLYLVQMEIKSRRVKIKSRKKNSRTKIKITRVIANGRAV